MMFFGLCPRKLPLRQRQIAQAGSSYTFVSRVSEEPQLQVLNKDAEAVAEATDARQGATERVTMLEGSWFLDLNIHHSSRLVTVL
jgi:16S rRNA C1402 N4-methylase RsmH